MAKIAAELKQALARRHRNGESGQLTARPITCGEGWTVSNVLCTSGPRDRTFEEQHTGYRVALVLAGTFQYRSEGGDQLMAPGSVLLGNAGQFFECSHDHGTGDHCLSFGYTPEFFERIASDAGVPAKSLRFCVPGLPSLRALSTLLANAGAALASADPGSAATFWEEISVQIAVQSLRVAHGVVPRATRVTPSDVARVTRAVRRIEHNPCDPLPLGVLAEEAGWSPYHFLRTFQHLMGVTPHQYVRRARLREAARRLVTEPGKVLEIALDCGFADISAFNRAFRTEFGVSPREYRSQKPSALTGFSRAPL